MSRPLEAAPSGSHSSWCYVSCCCRLRCLQRASPRPAAVVPKSKSVAGSGIGARSPDARSPETENAPELLNHPNPSIVPRNRRVASFGTTKVCCTSPLPVERASSAPRESPRTSFLNSCEYFRMKPDALTGDLGTRAGYILNLAPRPATLDSRVCNNGPAQAPVRGPSDHP